MTAKERILVFLLMLPLVCAASSPLRAQEYFVSAYAEAECAGPDVVLTVTLHVYDEIPADLVGWVYGLENMVYASYDQPGFLHALLDIIATWNRLRMEVLLDARIDLYIKRAWYGNCDFWTPATFREFLFPILKADAELAHSKGTRLGYIITSNCMPLLEIIAETGVDVLIGVDPQAWDLAETRRRLEGQVCLWGGVNGHLTVERGSPSEVRAEVRRAMQVLGRGGGFVLSPVDNVRESTPRTEANVRALIDEWRRLTGQQAAVQTDD